MAQYSKENLLKYTSIPGKKSSCLCWDRLVKLANFLCLGGNGITDTKSIILDLFNIFGLSTGSDRSRIHNNLHFR